MRLFKKTSREYFVLLLPAVIACYVVMTLDVDKLRERILIEWIKLALGLFSAMVLIRYNITRYSKKKNKG